MGRRFVSLPPSLHRCVSPAETDRLYPGLPEWDAGVQILPWAPDCQRVRIGIAACLRNRCLRVRISPLATRFLDPPRLLQCRWCVWLIQMKMTPEFDDAQDFIRHVEQVVNGVVRRYSPETLVLIKINNWFGSKWLGFFCKALGALGVWNKPRNEPADNIRIPPFLPSRVLSQRSFAAPTHDEVSHGKTMHTQLPSN